MLIVLHPPKEPPAASGYAEECAARRRRLLSWRKWKGRRRWLRLRAALFGRRRRPVT